MAQTLTVAAAYDLLDQGKGVEDIATAAAAPTSTDINWLNSGNEALLVVAGATGLTVTVKAVADPYGRGGAAAGGGGDDNDQLHTVPNNGFAIIPFCSPAMFNQGGQINVVLGNITTVKLLLIRLRKNR